jgi:hypothetical protein
MRIPMMHDRTECPTGCPVDKSSARESADTMEASRSRAGWVSRLADVWANSTPGATLTSILLYRHFAGYSLASFKKSMVCVPIKGHKVHPQKTFIATIRKTGDSLENLAGGPYIHRHTPQNRGLAPSFTPRQPQESRTILSGKLGACPLMMRSISNR